MGWWHTLLIIKWRAFIYSTFLHIMCSKFFPWHSLSPDRPPITSTFDSILPSNMTTIGNVHVKKINNNNNSSIHSTIVQPGCLLGAQRFWQNLSLIWFQVPKHTRVNGENCVKTIPKEYYTGTPILARIRDLTIPSPTYPLLWHRHYKHYT